MLLEELINTKTKEYSLKNPIGKIKEPKDILGKGTASVISNDKNDPHMVNKKSHDVNFNERGLPGFTMGRYDGFRDYAKFIVDNNLAEKNPWFPRIYEMKNFSHNDSGQNVQKYKMEKLIELDDLSDDEISFLIEKMFNFETREDHPSDNLNFLTVLISEIINHGVSYSEKVNNIKIIDETFLSAIKYLEEFEVQYDANFEDIFTNGNIMFRRTPHGPQLVIVDPVY